MTLVPLLLRRGCVALVAVLLATSVSACGSGAGTGDKGYVDGKGVITEVAPGERKPVKEISGRTLQGKKISLADLGHGKPVVVNVWASWCAECRLEERHLAAAAKELGSQASFLGINVRDPGSKDASLAYERRFRVSYPSLYDPSGRTLLAFPGGFSPYAIPSTVVLDSLGRVAASIQGAIPSTQTLVDLVQGADK